jgi:hypothetical protein
MMLGPRCGVAHQTSENIRASGTPLANAPLEISAPRHGNDCNFRIARHAGAAEA